MIFPAVPRFVVFIRPGRHTGNSVNWVGLPATGRHANRVATGAAEAAKMVALIALGISVLPK